MSRMGHACVHLSEDHRVGNQLKTFLTENMIADIVAALDTGIISHAATTPRFSSLKCLP